MARTWNNNPRFCLNSASRCQNFGLHFLHILTRLSPCLYGVEAHSDGWSLTRWCQGKVESMGYKQEPGHIPLVEGVQRTSNRQHRR